ncbi:hypothetical protein F7725_023630, partial [Dissostichus mawsoni]
MYMYYSYFTSVLLTVNSMMHFLDQWIDSLSNMDLMFGAFSLIVLFIYSVPAAGGEHHHFREERAEEDPEGLSSDYPECLEILREDEEVLDGEDEEQRRSSREAFLNITLHFLRSMKQEELADRLQSKRTSRAQRFPELLEENSITFVKNELKKFQNALCSDYPECLESQREDEEVLDGEDEEQRRSSREAFLNITLHFLRSMKQEELADRLQSSKR